jgi:hypothetical protein
MNILKHALPIAAAACLAASVPFAVAPVNTGATVLAAPSASGVEHLTGELVTGLHHHHGKASSTSELQLHVHVHHGRAATDATALHGKTVSLTASGSVLSKLHALAGKHAHVRVSGTLSGNTMTVTEVSEVHHHHK